MDTGPSYDPVLASSHSYLGEVWDVTGSGSDAILPGGSHWLPVLPLEGVVLVPGAKLPLLATQSSEINALRHATSQPPPLKNLIAVMYWSRYPTPNTVVGCTAELKQLSPGSSTSPAWRAIARGRQRVHIYLDEINNQGCARVEVLQEGSISPVPLPIREGYSSVAPAITRPWDLHFLANMARGLCHAILPVVAGFQGPPHLLAWHMAANMPIEGNARQRLLEAHDPAERLRRIITILKHLGHLTCALCGNQIADASNAIAMTQDGVASAFVNAHGFVHDTLTLSSVHTGSVALQGRPETEHSWFPGYAWQICNCHLCRSHLGWRFTRVASQPKADEASTPASTTMAAEGSSAGIRAGTSQSGALTSESSQPSVPAQAMESGPSQFQQSRNCGKSPGKQRGSKEKPGSEWPTAFWGLRREALTCGAHDSRPGTPGDSQEEAGEEEEEEEEWESASEAGQMFEQPSQDEEEVTVDDEAHLEALLQEEAAAAAAAGDSEDEEEGAQLHAGSVDNVGPQSAPGGRQDAEPRLPV